MSNNAVVLSPYSVPPTESTNEFQSVELRRATVIPAAAVDHVRVTGGPTAFAQPSLALRGEGDDQVFFVAPLFLSAVNGYVTDSSYASWTMDNTLYDVAVTGFTVTIAFALDWTLKSGTVGNFRAVFPGAPAALATSRSYCPPLVMATTGLGSVIQGLAIPAITVEPIGGVPTVVAQFGAINQNGTYGSSVPATLVPTNGSVFGQLNYFVDRTSV